MSVDVPPVKFPEVRISASALPGQNDPAAIFRTVDGARERASELAKHHDHDQYSTSFDPAEKTSRSACHDGFILLPMRCAKLIV
jgi:hypothetical protein